MRCLAIMCAEEIIVDLHTNKLSIINHIEDIVSPSFPIALTKLGIVIVLAKEPGDGDHYNPTLKVSNGAHVLVSAPAHVSFVGANKTRIIASFEGLPLPTPAPLIVGLHLDKLEIASYTIDVQSAARAEIAPARTVSGTQALVSTAQKLATEKEQPKPRRKRQKD